MNIYNTTRIRKVKCETCGKYFTTSHPSKKTCSVECSMVLKERTMKQANKDTNRYFGKKKHK